MLPSKIVGNFEKLSNSDWYGENESENLFENKCFWFLTCFKITLDRNTVGETLSIKTFLRLEITCIT